MTDRRAKPFVVGVTGGIGSGKSTVADLFAERGARVLDADRIVRSLYEPGELADRIFARFGAGVRHPDGSVDRPKLADVVFEDPVALHELEEMVHPAVRAHILAKLTEWASECFDGVVVIDAALLVEADHPYPLDALVVVVAPEGTRVERLSRRGMPPEEARRRMVTQATDETKRARADFVLENAGTLEDLRHGVAKLWRQLERDDPSSSG